ncbi:fibrous sheath CABYR-binding protein [Drosophila nasuta]|uniref:fibrous sheath CABYR-binding protein n=1 Tax=Drosophila nasuta TaxID=42062 RepID=UPI00295F236D|nr:fibrous sheath CABYR-binding protein [Drosophila nasuta]
MWKYICALIFLSVCCNAGPLNQQRKNMPIKAREDSVVMSQESQTQTETESEVQTEAEAAAPLVGTLTLPSNATSIRADITDSFSCANKSYGYYADVENDCQIFHVCLPVTYADGKENTFRWSFICPEETIFSQESFTCMRREDMTIECEESYRYYELNSNFGVSTEEEKQPAASAVESEQIDQQPEQSEAPAAPAEPAPEPVVEPAKPVKVQKPKPKPNRRKPAVTYNKPQRKAPVPATSAPVVEPVEAVEPEPVAVVVAPLAAKPKPQRFNARPNKEKPQTQKPAAPIRNELFNAIRKRPAIFNKPTTKPVEESEAAVTEAIQAQAELSEPQPTLKLQTMFVDTAPVVPVQVVEEPVPEASEPVVAIPEPEPIKSEIVAEQDAPIKMELNEVQPVEAFEEIPAVIAETLEEKPQEIEQPVEQPAKEQQPAELPVEQPAEILVEQPAQQPEELPIETEEKPEVQQSAEQPIEQPSQSEISQTIAEEPKFEAAPAIVEPSNSNEEALNNIEVLEAAKPADAPESLPATPEMAQPSPLVEEMLDNSGNIDESMKQTAGGFKPVDPVMAAEAEQLITDFLNTLRKHEEKTETELASAAMDMAETIEQQPQAQESEVKPETELLKTPEEQADNVSIEEQKLPEPEIIDKNASVEEQLLEGDTEPEPQPKLKLTQDSPIYNIMQLNHLPADYQIPVQVVSMPEPVEEPASETAQEVIQETAPQLPAEPEQKPVETEPQMSLATAAYMPPISIDDIVELVKERLDQNPKNEQLAPMELILTPGAAAPMALIQSNTPVAEPEPEPASSAEQEEVILPIYKRISIAEPSMSKVQTAPVTVSKVEEPEQQSDELKTQTKMDARKRRFLFRADAS